MVIKQLIKPLARKAAQQGLKALESSASKTLKGQPFKESVINKVTKGKGDWRYVILENGNVELVDKKVVNSLARAKGTTTYSAQFEASNTPAQTVQAYKALSSRLKGASKDKKLILDYQENYRQQLKLTGGDIPALSLCEKDKKFFTLPTLYAKRLEKDKVLKILQELK